jgi:pyruvate formate lyase activating enzyme
VISRRKFLETVLWSAPLAGGVAMAGPAARWFSPEKTCLPGGIEGAGFSPLQDLARSAPRARYWTSFALAASDCSACHSPDERLDPAHKHVATTVRCQLCAQNCTITAGARGKCRARANVKGELRSLVYGRPLALHVDPIEKKPFYNFLPGVEAFSLGTAGCPLHCQFCQNWTLSRASPEDYDTPYLAPDALVRAATSRRSPVIAFTYNEPTVFTEYLLDTAREARKRNVRCVMVSCGFMNQAPLGDMCEALDAIKIDLKGFSEDFYHKVCGAELQPVLRSIRQVARSGVHLEIVNLMVPTLNDKPETVRGLIDWVAGELGPDVPVHFTRFHPDYQLMNLPPTPVPTLERARDAAMAKGLHYVYIGNVPDHPGNNTYCPKCGKVVIERTGFFVEATHLKKGACAYCGTKIAGVFDNGSA